MDRFRAFLESFRTNNNQSLIESIHQGYTAIFEGMSVEEKYEKFWKKSVPRDVFEKILLADPTKKKAFTKWMIELMLNGKLLVEDLYKAKEYLYLFSTYRNHLKRKNISDYESLPDLLSAVKPYRPDDSEAGGDYEEQSKILINKGEAELFYKNDEWMVVIPKTLKASCHFGKNTEWCTTHSNNFEAYTKMGPLFILHNEDAQGHDRLQFHFETLSFMDENDEEVDIFNKMDVNLPPDLMAKFKPKVNRGVNKYVREYLTDDQTHSEEVSESIMEHYFSEFEYMYAKSIEKDFEEYEYIPSYIRNNSVKVAEAGWKKNMDNYAFFSDHIRLKLGAEVAMQASEANPDNYLYVPKELKDELGMEFAKEIQEELKERDGYQ